MVVIRIHEIHDSLDVDNVIYPTLLESMIPVYEV